MTQGANVDKRVLLQYYQAQRNDSDRMYGANGRQFKQRRRLEVLKATLQAVLTRRRETLTVLDAGSGDGFAASVVLNGVRFRSYTAIDLSLVKLRAACTRMEGAAASADLEALPIRPASVDLVLCSEVLEHLPDPGAAMKGFHDAMRPGALCLLSCPIDAALQPWLYRTARLLRPPKVMAFDEHIQLFTARSLTRLAKAAGFEILARRFCGLNFPLLSLLESRLPYGAYRWLDGLGAGSRMGNFGYNGRVTLAIGCEYAVFLLQKSTHHVKNGLQSGIANRS